MHLEIRSTYHDENKRSDSRRKGRAAKRVRDDIIKNRRELSQVHDDAGASRQIRTADLILTK